MTFDELLNKYRDLITMALREKYIVDPTFWDNLTTPSYRKDLLDAMKAEVLHLDLSPEDNHRAALLLAKELVSLHITPESHGANIEGVLGAFSEVDALDPNEALIEAPSLAVDVRVPPKE